MRRFFITVLVVTGTLFSFSGCGGHSTSFGVPGTGNQGRLYVSIPTTNTIVRFDNAFTATGGATPGGTLAGAATQLASPQHLLIDAQNNRLYVANLAASSILVFDNATTKTGNTAPDRTISGAATTLNAPNALALDSGNSLLYVADGPNVLVFANPATINGNTSPIRTLGMGFGAGALFLDQTNNRLFAANTLGDQIAVYDNASGLPSGVVVANRTISGASTGLNRPSGLGLDGTGRLVVSNLNAPSITIYASAATANGNLAPAATISGALTGLGNPTQLALNNSPGSGDTGDVYVADGTAASVLVFTNITTANGNVAPARKITNLTGAKGLALDTTR
jgi:hypothetical protein